MRSLAIVAVLALSSALVACGERANSPIKTGTTGAVVTPTASAPPAATDRESPPATVPPTHAQAPQAPQPEATSAPTARDTPAAGPLNAMTKAEESQSMPKPGQVNNYSTPSIQGATTGSQQSPGTPPPAAPAPAK